MSSATVPGKQAASVGGPDATAGASGEGAASALQAMLKKRQMRVDPGFDAAVPSPSPQPGPRAPARKGGE